MPTMRTVDGHPQGSSKLENCLKHFKFSVMQMGSKNSSKKQLLISYFFNVQLQYFFRSHGPMTTGPLVLRSLRSPSVEFQRSIGKMKIHFQIAFNFFLNFCPTAANLWSTCSPQKVQSVGTRGGPQSQDFSQKLNFY